MNKTASSVNHRAERNSLLKSTAAAAVMAAVFLGASFTGVIDPDEAQIRQQVVHNELMTDIERQMNAIKNDFKVSASRDQPLPFELAARGVLKPEKIEAQVKAEAARQSESFAFILQGMSALFVLISAVGLGGAAAEHAKMKKRQEAAGQPSAPPAPS